MSEPRLNEEEVEVAFKLYEYIEEGQPWILDDHPPRLGGRKGLKQICEDSGAGFEMTIRYFIHLGFLHLKPPKRYELEGTSGGLDHPRFSSELDIGGALISFVREMSVVVWSKPRNLKEWRNVFGVSESTFQRMRTRSEIRIRQSNKRGKWEVDVRNLPPGVVS